MITASNLWLQGDWHEELKSGYGLSLTRTHSQEWGWDQWRRRATVNTNSSASEIKQLLHQMDPKPIDASSIPLTEPVQTFTEGYFQNGFLDHNADARSRVLDAIQSAISAINASQKALLVGSQLCREDFYDWHDTSVVPVEGPVLEEDQLMSAHQPCSAHQLTLSMEMRAFIEDRLSPTIQLIMEWTQDAPNQDHYFWLLGYVSELRIARLEFVIRLLGDYVIPVGDMLGLYYAIEFVRKQVFNDKSKSLSGFNIAVTLVMVVIYMSFTSSVTAEEPGLVLRSTGLHSLGSSFQQWLLRGYNFDDNCSTHVLVLNQVASWVLFVIPILYLPSFRTQSWVRGMINKDFIEWVGHCFLYADWSLSWVGWCLLCCTVPVPKGSPLSTSLLQSEEASQAEQVPEQPPGTKTVNRRAHKGSAAERHGKKKKKPTEDAEERTDSLVDWSWLAVCLAGSSCAGCLAAYLVVWLSESWAVPVAVGSLACGCAIWLAVDLVWSDDPEPVSLISWKSDDPSETPANENIPIKVRNVKKPKKKRKTVPVVQDAHDDDQTFSETSSMNTTANQQQQMPQFTTGLVAAEATVSDSVFTSSHAADVGSGSSADELKVDVAQTASKASTKSSTTKFKSTNKLDSGGIQMTDVQNDHDVTKDVSMEFVNRESKVDPNTDIDSRAKTALGQRMSSEQIFARVVSAVEHPAAHPDGDLLVPDVDEGKCVICIDQDSTHVLVECGHWCVCEMCVQEIVPGVCPICRVGVTKSIRVFKS